MSRMAQTQPSARTKPRRARGIGTIVALALLVAASLNAAEPGVRELARAIAQRESKTEAARSQYAYRQSLTVQELNGRGAQVGEYREVRDVIFMASGERTERLAERPRDTLRNLRLTGEDFRDVREIQSMLLTSDQLWNYEVKSKGTEAVEGIDCYVVEVRPRQILQGQRFFEGRLWAGTKDYSIVRIEGRAVPQHHSSSGKENLFPQFTTIRMKVGENWFPAQTFADDTLDFRTGPQRIRMVIRYSGYQRFEAESVVKP